MSKIIKEDTYKCSFSIAIKQYEDNEKGEYSVEAMKLTGQAVSKGDALESPTYYMEYGDNPDKLEKKIISDIERDWFKTV